MIIIWNKMIRLIKVFRGKIFGFDISFALTSLLLLIFFSFNSYPKENELSFTNYTSEDGLSLNSVTQIIQDHRGFLWFGTYNGLNRFDGYTFKIFLPDSKSTKDISNYSIWALCEDDDGYIWIGTLDGLNRYDWRTEEFHVYKNEPGNASSLSSNTILSIYKNRDGEIFIGTINGLNKYNRESDDFTVIKKVCDVLSPDSLNTVTSISEDAEGILWLGTWNGLTLMNKRWEITDRFFVDPVDSRNHDYRKISKIINDMDNNIWIGMNGKGLKKYDYTRKTFKEYKNIPGNNTSLSNDYVTVLSQDKAGNIWVGTKNGFNKYNPVTDSFIRIMNNPDKPLSIINNEILSMNEDSNGLMWVGTSGGISMFYQTRNKFKYYSADVNHAQKNTIVGISSNMVTSLCADRYDNLWIGTFEGLDLIKKGSDQIIHFKHEPENPNSLSDNYVISVNEDRAGNIWIGTHNNGLNKYNPETGTFKLYSYDVTDKQTLSNNGILSTSEDRKGNFWIGTWWGLNYFDIKTEKFKRYNSNPLNPDLFKNDLLWKVFIDSEDKVWLGTDGGGVCRFDPETNHFTNFTNDTTNPNYISGLRVFDILESHDKLLWFCTTGGLNCYNRKTGNTKVYTTENGLAGILTSSIIEDNNGNLWIGTDRGLSKFDRKNNVFINFSKKDGLKDLEFTLKCAAKSKDGTLYFGIKNGIVYFNPDEIADDKLTAPVVFTDLKIYNQSVTISLDGILRESITTAKSINIPPGVDDITIEFALLNYLNVVKNQFEYIMEGYDADWNNNENKNSATYANLEPGEYTFIVKAYSNNNRKNAKTASIHLTVVPFFYETWWFRIGLGFGILILIVFIFRARTQEILKRNRILESRVAERTKDLANIINDLNQEIIERRKAEEKVQASLIEKEGFLSEKEVLLKEIHHRVKNNLQVISSLFYLNSKKIKDKEALEMFKDSQNRVKSIALVHERLYQSKDLGRIDFKEYVVKLTKDLFRSYGVNDSVVKLEININKIYINIDNAVPCGLIINELISNSLKYAFPNYEEDGKTGCIKIDFNRTANNELTLIVSDNGVGMPEGYTENKQHSLGLQLVDTLIAQLEGTLEMDLSSGTSYRIRMNTVI